ncbi:MAG: IPT/TIG domain-containing protein [Prevotellaceae bacterium]|jgi:hypothetical protein|nr:IPT/TIG domain-containing protein [Prevotellaceae bacterium]
MKFNKYINNALLIVLTAVMIVGFSACRDDDDKNSGEIVFESYGPSPSPRGGKLTFIGKNLDKIVKVILPDGIEITDIEVIDSEHIKVVIPQNAVPGYVKLIGPNSVEFTSKTLLTFTEPILLTSMSPNPVKPGTVLTLEGDYLNLVRKVILSDGVEVVYTDFSTWERGKIEFVVPFEAQTGTVILSDTAEVPFELVSENVLEVILPSVTAPDLTNKKPGDVITIEGENLDLVVAVITPAGDTIPFTVNGNQITFTLPENISDGTIIMIPASGVHVALANIGVVAPAELVVAPATGIRAGDELTITGVNMDLVTTLNFEGVTDAVAPTSKTATQVKVNMPSMGITGNITLNTASGKTAEIAISTLKPEVLAYNPNPVAAGTNVTLQGHNLDLVKFVTFGGNVEVEVTQTSDPSTLVVSVPTSAETGALTLTMANTETVACPSLTVDKPVCAYIPAMPDGEIKGGKLWVVTLENEDKLTGVQLNGQTVQYVLDGDQLYIGIPSNAYGNCTLKLISSNGEIEYTINVVPGGSVETVIWEGTVDITWADGGRVMIEDSKFAGVTAGTYLKFYFQQKEAWGQVQINNGGWAAIPFAELGNDGYLKTDGPMINNDKSITSVEVKLTQSVLDNIITNAADGWGIIMQGENWIFNKVTLLTKAKITTNIWTGSQDTGNWANFVQLAFDLFSNVKVGDMVKVSTANVASGAQGSFKTMSDAWPQIAEGTEYFDISGDFQLEVTDEIKTKLQATGLVIGGHDYTVTKVDIISEM